MAYGWVIERLRDQSARASGYQKCRALGAKSRNHPHANKFGHDEVAYEASQYTDIGQIIFLGGPKDTTAMYFYRHAFIEFLDPDLYKLREAKAKRRRVAHVSEPRAEIVYFAYDIIECGTENVVGELITRRFKAPGTRNHWALKQVTFRGQVHEFLGPGVI
jgi:hypothetical protein